MSTTNKHVYGIWLIQSHSHGHCCLVLCQLDARFISPPLSVRVFLSRNDVSPSSSCVVSSRVLGPFASCAHACNGGLLCLHYTSAQFVAHFSVPMLLIAERSLRAVMMAWFLGLFSFRCPVRGVVLYYSSSSIHRKNICSSGEDGNEALPDMEGRLTSDPQKKNASIRYYRRIFLNRP